MRLELNDEDLKFECRDVNPSMTKFEHFQHEAQKAIEAVGKGTYYNNDRSNYNVIYPPSFFKA